MTLYDKVLAEMEHVMKGHMLGTYTGMWSYVITSKNAYGFEEVAPIRCLKSYSQNCIIIQADTYYPHSAEHKAQPGLKWEIKSEAQLAKLLPEISAAIQERRAFMLRDVNNMLERKKLSAGAR